MEEMKCVTKCVTLGKKLQRQKSIFGLIYLSARISKENSARINKFISTGKAVSKGDALDKILTFFFNNESFNDLYARKMEAEINLAALNAQIKVKNEIVENQKKLLS